ncbi:hypothetical protein ISN45_Aa04g025530 [Arabidopsis thaliana x Arabidopsis arenosa]|uniref:Uncharacterized protein n=1 Tax=Arabidopsis thaliana x Arabidopsis arenosa TaxID=1240361 RepID=A0A8T2AE52_9BRAS|nr:hypothetical protein ISN45_Aa04g025530 [Arabidopsis thaliana x Arabidopsis arenosa]
MFSNWLQLRRRRHQISPDSPKWPRHFSCSSFKDIQNLLHEDDSPPKPYSLQGQIIHQPRSPRIQRCISNVSFLPPMPTPTLFSTVDIPSADHRGVVLYYTSLRIIRKTFEECKSVYIGGVKEIKQLQENDKLKELIDTLPPSDKIFDEICDLCRGWRFVVCDRCNGSHKIFLEKSGFTNCTSCNVQGLIRCVSCFPMHRRRNSESSGRVKCMN